MKKSIAAIAIGTTILAVVGTSATVSSRETDKSEPLPLKADTPAVVPNVAPAIRLVVAPEENSARYIIQEQLVGFDLPSKAIGATSDVSGVIALDANGNVIPGDSRIQVSVASLQSDSDRRDGFVRGRILETDSYPSVELAPTALSGVALPLPESGMRRLSLTGNLTVHGVTRPTTWEVTATFAGNVITGTASTSFAFADFALTQPRVPVVLRVADTIRLEYRFKLLRQAA